MALVRRRRYEKMCLTVFCADWDIGKNFPGKWRFFAAFLTLPAITEKYRGHLFIGMHGQFVSHVYAGIHYLEWDHDAKAPVSGSESQQFIPDGWGNPPGSVGSRVADLKFHPDGRMFFCDDFTGDIHWIAPTTLARPNKPGETLPPTPPPAPTSAARHSPTVLLLAVAVLTRLY